MAGQINVLAFSGSLRKASWNTKLVRAASKGAEAAGAKVTNINLADFDLPVFSEDLEVEKGLPSGARKLKDLFLSHQGLLIASPEYNSSVTAALKNAIDWVSRPVAGEPPLGCFDQRVAGLLAASPGALGGLRGLVHLRAILGNIRVIVLPEQFALAKSHEAFAEDGSLKDAAQRAGAEGIGRRVAEIARKVHA